MNAQTAADLWWSWIVPISAQVGVLTLVALVIDRALRVRAWPQVRTALWGAVLLRFVLPPQITSPWSVSAVALERGRDLLAGRIVGASSVRAASDVPIAPSSVLPVVLGALWIAGFVVLAAREWMRARSLARQFAEAPDAPDFAQDLARDLCARLHIAHAPRVVLSRRFASPALVGAVRPCVVLPIALVESRASEDVEHALLHELAHWKRRDGLQALAVRVLQLLFWFHPAAWIAGRRLAELRELGCDAAVARVLRDRTPAYRASLLRAARASVFGPDWSGANANGFVSGPNLLLLRLASLERPSPRHERTQRGAALLLFVVLCACIVPMAKSARELGAALDPLVRQAFVRLQHAAHSTERQNCLETQAASRVLIAHRELTGEDLLARIH